MMDGPDQLDRNLAVLRRTVTRHLASRPDGESRATPAAPEPQVAADGTPGWLARLLGFGDR
jgi:hypothetical protein